MRRAAGITLAMVEFSRQQVPGMLWEGGDFILSRSASADHVGSMLVLAPVSERPAPRIIARLEHEYSLRDELDSDWAVRPLALTRREVGQSSFGRVRHRPNGAFRVASPTADHPGNECFLLQTEAIRGACLPERTKKLNIVEKTRMIFSNRSVGIWLRVLRN